MSESINISQGTTSPSNPICFGSVGLLAASIEAKVVDVDSKMSLPPNEIGELWVRSPQNMKGNGTAMPCTKLLIWTVLNVGF